MDKIANHVTLSRQLEALQKVCSVDPGKQWNAHLLAHAVRQAQQEKEPEVTWVARCQIYPGLVGIDQGSDGQTGVTCSAFPGLSSRYILVLGLLP